MSFSLPLVFCSLLSVVLSRFFFFTDPATTEIYTLSLHDALPILPIVAPAPGRFSTITWVPPKPSVSLDRKSTRLNSSHLGISYAVFCLKKKKKKTQRTKGLTTRQ